LVQCICLRQ